MKYIDAYNCPFRLYQPYPEESLFLVRLIIDDQVIHLGADDADRPWIYFDNLSVTKDRKCGYDLLIL